MNCNILLTRNPSIYNFYLVNVLKIYKSEYNKEIEGLLMKFNTLI